MIQATKVRSAASLYLYHRKSFFLAISLCAWHCDPALQRRYGDSEWKQYNVVTVAGVRVMQCVAKAVRSARLRLRAETTNRPVSTARPDTSSAKEAVKVSSPSSDNPQPVSIQSRQCLSSDTFCCVPCKLQSSTWTSDLFNVLTSRAGTSK